MPLDTWQAGFLANIGRQIGAGKPLSEKQQAVVERLRERNPEDTARLLRGEYVKGMTRQQLAADPRFAAWVAGSRR